MSPDEKDTELAIFRLKQAQESLDEANLLLKSKKSPRSVINRAYYAMFYSVLALLAFENFSTSKHSGVISYFNKRFIKEGLLPKKLSTAIGGAFDLRQFGDYREFSEISHSEVKPYISQAEEFIKKVTAYLEQKGLI